MYMQHTNLTSNKRLKHEQHQTHPLLFCTGKCGPALETYIDITKTSLSDQLPSLFQSAKQNLPKQQKHWFKRTRQEITIKPADKNFGLVVVNTNDYIIIHVCSLHLANTSTYQKTDNFPAFAIQKQLEEILLEFSSTLKEHKNLSDYLVSKPNKTQILWNPQNPQKLHWPTFNFYTLD